jgi:hypothetical protein
MRMQREVGGKQACTRAARSLPGTLDSAVAAVSRTDPARGLATARAMAH